jgi:hypothetical protein
VLAVAAGLRGGQRWGTQETPLLDSRLEIARQRVAIPDSGALRSDLLQYTRQIIASITTPEFTAITRTFAAGAAHSPTLADTGRAYWTDPFALAHPIFERAVQRCELPPDTEPNLLIEAFLGPLYLRLLITGETFNDVFAERIVDPVLSGARAQHGAIRMRQATRASSPLLHRDRGSTRSCRPSELGCSSWCNPATDGWDVASQRRVLLCRQPGPLHGVSV